MQTSEGKQPLTFSGYRFLAAKAIRQTTDIGLSMMSHLFLILCWNLIARCCTVASIMFDHIGWEEDAMTIVIPKQKNDQEGKNSAKIHVYANNSNPEICPILAMAIHVFSIAI